MRSSVKTWKNCFSPITVVSTENTPKLKLIENRRIMSRDNEAYFLEKWGKERLEAYNDRHKDNRSYGGFAIGSNEYFVCINCGSADRYDFIELPAGTEIKLNGVVKRHTSGGTSALYFNGTIEDTSVWVDYDSLQELSFDSPRKLWHMGIGKKSISKSWRCHFLGM